MFDVMGAIKTVGELIGSPVKGWQERKTLKETTKSQVAIINAQAEVAKANAKIEAIKQGQMIVSDWDQRAQEQMGKSFKDEIIATIWFWPVLMLFISAFFVNPAFQNRVIDSVDALNKFPTWYIVLMMGIVASSFGLRWLIQPLISRGIMDRAAQIRTFKVSDEDKLIIPDNDDLGV